MKNNYSFNNRMLATGMAVTIITLGLLLMGGVALAQQTSSNQITNISPSAGTQVGSSATFSWNQVTNASRYHVYVGNQGPGSSNILSRNLGTQTSVNINGLPQTGATINFRVWYQINGNWQSQDFTYMTSGQFSGTTPSFPDTGFYSL